MAGLSVGRFIFSAPGRVKTCVSAMKPCELWSDRLISPMNSSIRALSLTSSVERLKSLRVEEQLGISEPPSKPLGPYLRWAKENRSQLLLKSPSQKFTDFGKYLGQTWAAMTEDQKLPYVKSFEKDMVAYKESREKYLASLTDSEKAAISSARSAAKEKRLTRIEKLAVKKKEEAFEKPKRPQTAFMLYMTKRKGDLSNDDFKDRVKKMAQEWRNLPADKKQPFETEYHKALEAYKINIEKWEEKMLKLGQRDLVRASSDLWLDEHGKVQKGPKPTKSRRTASAKA